MSKWIKLTKELKKDIGQPVEGHSELLDDVIDWIMNVDTAKKVNIPIFDYFNTPSYHYRMVLSEGVKHPLDWDKRLASNCGGTVHLCDIRVSMILPLYTIDTFYLSYSRKENWNEDGPLKTHTQFEKKILKKIRSIMNKQDLTFVTKATARKRVRSAYTDINTEGNASIFDCLFSDIYGYFDYRTRCNDREIQDAITGAEVHWCEYFDARNKLDKKSVIRYFSSGDVTQTIFDKKKRIKSIKVSRKGCMKEFIIDVDERISRMNRSFKK